MPYIQNEDLIIKKITEFVENDPRNPLPSHNNMKIYGTPLIDFASADD